MDSCPVKRTVGIVPVAGKPPPGMIIATESQAHIQVIKVQDDHHEWIILDNTRIFCKWCVEIRNLEVST